jgi:hypothetical protein
MDTVTEESRGRRSRRAFSAEFKRMQIEPLVRSEVTAAELSRESYIKGRVVYTSSLS